MTAPSSGQHGTMELNRAINMFIWYIVKASSSNQSQPYFSATFLWYQPSANSPSSWKPEKAHARNTQSNVIGIWVSGPLTAIKNLSLGVWPSTATLNNPPSGQRSSSCGAAPHLEAAHAWPTSWTVTVIQRKGP